MGQTAFYFALEYLGSSCSAFMPEVTIMIVGLMLSSDYTAPTNC
ncbi:hypothetical protein OMP94_08315 [Methylophaga sp. OBS3]|nr:hypothetical protein [Methylophaga sp. OBS3]